MDKEKSNKIKYWQNIREYWDLLGNYKRFLMITLILMVLTQGAYIINNFLFKELIDAGTGFNAGTILQSQLIATTSWILTVFLATSLLIALFDWLGIHFIGRTKAGTSINLKQKYFSRILRLDYAFHTRNKVGSTISRLIRSSGAVDHFTDTIVYSFSPLLIQLAILIPILFQMGAIYSVIIILVSIVYIIHTMYISKFFGRDRGKENEALDIERAKVSDIFTNISSVKFFGKTRLVERDFSNLAKNTGMAQIKALDWWRWLISGQDIILGVGTVLILYVSINQFISGEVTLGTLTFIYTAYVGLIGQLYNFSQGIRDITSDMADMQDLFEYQNVEIKIKDLPNAKPINIEKGEVEFKNVSFGFKKECLFKDFNLKIEGGKTIALVGHSGCGKTTIIKILYRLHDVHSGEILVDSQNIKDVTQESLRSEMSIVPQESILFDDTIYNNILFSRPEALREQVLEAMKFAQLDKFVEDLPEKEQTMVGERGIKLSGGEKQRVAIARAILANKKILVFDEATSSLDSRTENEIQKDLEKLMKGRTAIVIAHRLSTIMNSDEIIVLSRGKIVQRGTHEELLKQGGEYKTLWDLQKGGYIP